MGKHPVRYYWLGDLLTIRTLAVVALLADPVDSLAHSKTHHLLKIQHPWTLEGQTGPAVVHMTIQNTGSKPDRLVSAACTQPCHAALQGGSEGSAGVPLPPKSLTTFQSSGFMLVLEGLEKSLTAYDRIPLTLTFEVAGQLSIDVMVEPVNE